MVDRNIQALVSGLRGCLTGNLRIARLLPDALAVVDTGSGEEQVSVALVTVTTGDRILVHAGEAIAVVGR